METMYTLWGRPKTTTDALEEKVLLSEATAAQCDKIEKLADKDGWHMFRRIPVDNAMPDFVGAINL